jgi:hypothetical protein
MPIRPIGTPAPVTTNNKNTTQQHETKSRASKGIAETSDSFEPHQGGISDLFGAFQGPVIGTVIGKAIGNSANTSKETQATSSSLGDSHIQLESTNANDQAIDIANKQKDLLDNEKQPRRQTFSLKLKKPDPD